jgi:hypothetical protein
VINNHWLKFHNATGDEEITIRYPFIIKKLTISAIALDVD